MKKKCIIFAAALCVALSACERQGGHCGSHRRGKCYPNDKAHRCPYPCGDGGAYRSTYPGACRYPGSYARPYPQGDGP